MKKFFFSLLLIASLQCAIHAQTPVIRIDGQDVTNSFVDCRATTSDMEQYMSFKFNVCNETGNPIVVDLRKVVVREVEGTQNSFCFGSNCYAPSTFEVNDVSMPKDTILPMVCDYMGNGIEGVTVVRYEFITTDTVSLTVNYIIGNHDGILDAPNSSVTASLFPNPVIATSTFKCSVPSNVKTATLLIYSITGQKVEEFRLNSGENKIQVNASEFQSGLYLYSVIVNNHVMTTGKMVVK